MINALDRTKWALNCCTKTSLPIWVGISAKENDKGQLCTSFPEYDICLESLIKLVLKFKCVAAIGFMHTPANIMTRCLQLLKNFWKGPIYCYPDCGYFSFKTWKFRNLDCSMFIDYCQEWVREGVFMVGGCCGSTPEDIYTISQTLRQINNYLAK